MDPVTATAALTYGPPVLMFLIHVFAGFFKDRQHAQTVQAIATAGAQAAAAAAISGASPKQIGQAAAAAAIPVAIASLPMVGPPEAK